MADCHSRSDWNGRGLFPEGRAVGRTVKGTVVFGSFVASRMHTPKDFAASLPHCRLLHPSLSPSCSRTSFQSAHLYLGGSCLRMLLSTCCPRRINRASTLRLKRSSRGQVRQDCHRQKGLEEVKVYFRRRKVVVGTVIVAGAFGSSNASAVHVSLLLSPIK